MVAQTLQKVSCTANRTTQLPPNMRWRLRAGPPPRARSTRDRDFGVKEWEGREQFKGRGAPNRLQQADYHNQSPTLSPTPGSRR